jgi:hypothetical protein
MSDEFDINDGTKYIFTPWRRRFFAVLMAIGGVALMVRCADPIGLAIRYTPAARQAAQDRIALWEAQLKQLGSQMMDQIPVTPDPKSQPKFSPALTGDIVSVAMKIASKKRDLNQAQEARDHIGMWLGEFFLGAGACVGTVFLWPRKSKRFCFDQHAEMTTGMNK